MSEKAIDLLIAIIICYSFNKIVMGDEEGDGQKGGWMRNRICRSVHLNGGQYIFKSQCVGGLGLHPQQTNKENTNKPFGQNSKLLTL